MTMANSRGNRKLPGVVGQQAGRGPQTSYGELRCSYMTGPFDLEPPADCVATIILRFIGTENKIRTYAVWLLVGRYNKEANRVRYDPRAEDICCDIYHADYLCPALLARSMKPFLGIPAEGDPPVIKRTL